MADILEEIKGGVNKVTSPLGVKPFKGGPYPDKGLGDKALQSMAPVYEYANTLLEQSKTLPGFDQMGVLSQLPNVWRQYSKLTGVQNPFQETGPGVFHGTSPEEDPYALNPVQGRQLNKRGSEISTLRKQRLSELKANLSSRGLGDSSTMAAAEQRLNEQFDNLFTDEETAAMQGAYEQKLGTLEGLMQLLPMLYQLQQGQQQQGLSNAVSIKSGQSQQLNQMGQQAAAQQASLMNALMGLVGYGFMRPRGNTGIPQPRQDGFGNNPTTGPITLRR